MNLNNALTNGNEKINTENKFNYILFIIILLYYK